MSYLHLRSCSRPVSGILQAVEVVSADEDVVRPWQTGAQEEIGWEEKVP